jgi:tetratricopeptide (TPR) repeat protein
MDDYKNAIDFLQEMLEKTKNPAIRNAVYLMLGDNLEETGRPQEAINLLKQGLDENLKNSD